jgi:hypothetical protein
MNEKELKSLFWTALKSGHVRNNTIIPCDDVADLRVVEEANFRSFDLLIAAITPHVATGRNADPRLLARARLMTHFARRERCRADHIHFYPVELKSDEDTIDERLPNQIIDAILTFGLSIVVLDKNHSKKIKSLGLDTILPATIICYTGTKDYFDVVSVFDRFVTSGIFDFERMGLARLLQHNGNLVSAKAHRRLAFLQQLLQKIIFSQLHFDSPGLTEREEQFLAELAEIPVPNQKKLFASMIKETANRKLTDFS